MIKFKITPIGGYVIGDGPVPGNLDPDVFMKMFMHKVLDAQAQGKQELILNDEEIAEEIKQSMIEGIIDETQEIKDYCDSVIDDAEVIETDEQNIMELL